MASFKPNHIVSKNSYILYGFSGLENYREFVRAQHDKMRSTNKIIFDNFDKEAHIRDSIKSGFYGEGVTYEEMIGKITQFKNPGLIDKIYQQVSQKIPDNVKNKLKEKKLAFNDRGGVFSMDRFMMGMYKRPAFFSVQKNEYVRATEVYQDGAKYFLKEDRSDIEVHEKLSTNNKKVYAQFPQLPRDSKSIEVIIVAGANADVPAEKMLYTGCTGIILSELCEKAGIKVKISIVMGSSSDGDNIFALIPMKNYTAPVDRNIMALLTSDARIFRHEMFKSIVANYDYFDRNVHPSLGRLLTANEVINIFNDPEIRNLTISGDKVVFTSSIFTEKEVIRKIDEILENISK